MIFVIFGKSRFRILYVLAKALKLSPPHLYSITFSRPPSGLPQGSRSEVGLQQSETRHVEGEQGLSSNWTEARLRGRPPPLGGGGGIPSGGLSMFSRQSRSCKFETNTGNAEKKRLKLENIIVANCIFLGKSRPTLRHCVSQHTVT